MSQKQPKPCRGVTPCPWPATHAVASHAQIPNRAPERGQAPDLMSMMPEQALAVLKQIPDNENIQHQDYQDGNVVRPLVASPVKQLENFNRNKKRGLPDSEPAGPTY